MSRPLFFATIISVIILGCFTFISREYWSGVTQSALESPLVASFAAPTAVTVETPLAAAPTILFHQPAQEALRERQPTLYLAFDQPMDQASVGAALTVTPTLPLQLSWVENTVYIVPASPLESGSAYTFTLSTTAHSSQGAPLAAPYSWRYRSPNALIRTSPRTALARDHAFLLAFSSAMEQAATVRAFTLQPPIPFTTQWNAEATQLSLQPVTPLQPATTYTITFHQPLRDAAGHLVEQPDALTFTTAPAVVAVEPPNSTNVQPTTPIKLTFAPPFDQAATAATLQVSPPTTGTISWQGATLVFTPTAPLAPLTNYAISVTMRSLADDGTLLNSPPYAWTFTTADQTRWATFGYGLKVQSIAAAGSRAIQYFGNPFVNTTSELVAPPPPLTFALYPFDLAALFTLPSEKLILGPGELMATAGVEPITRWQTVLPPISNNHGGQPLLTNTIPPTVPAGLYLLNLETGYVNDQLLLLLTNYALAAKIADGQVTVWVTTPKGAVGAAVPVRVVDKTGVVLATGVTDENGLWQTVLADDAEPWLIIAQQDDEFAFTGLGNEWRSNLANQVWSPPATPVLPYSIYLYTDRPLYQPGQTIFFKGIVRHDEDAVLTTPPATTPVTIRVRDARDNIVRTYRLSTSALGTVHGEFAIATGAMLGDYTLEAEVNGALISHPFRVEEYRKPDYAVTVGATTNQSESGNITVTVAVTSHYLNGRPVANGAVTVTPYTLLADQYTYNHNPALRWTSNFPPNIGVTDATGHFTTTFFFDAMTTPYYGAAETGHWAVEATVDDGSRQRVSAVTLIDQVQIVETVVITTDGSVKAPGELVYLTVGATKKNGAPVAYQQMRLTAEMPVPTGVSLTPGVQAMELTTDQSGRLRVPFLPEKSGFYRLRLEGYSMKGYSLSTPAQTSLLVYDPAQPWVEQPDGFLTISADQATYTPGATATLTIASGYDGPALLTLERGTVRRTQLIHLTPPLTTVALPIQPADAPNLFVTVSAWTRPNPGQVANNGWQTSPDRLLRIASVTLAVTPVNKRLTIAVTPDQTSYAPRSAATFQIRVTDESGAPVAAELSLAMVDEAIFQLSADLHKPIYDTFYAPRPNRVQGYDAFAPRRMVGGGGGGGGGFLPANPRWHFPDTAIWLPVIETETNGTATVKLTLPDTLTSWRVVVKGVTAATQVGEATAKVVTSQPISLQPLLPPGLTSGDQATLSALLHNDTGLTQTLTVSLGFSPTQATALTLLTAPTQTVTLPPHATSVAGWGVQATGTHSVVLFLSAATAEFSDAVQVSLPIRPLAIPNVAVQVGHFTGTFTTAIPLPTALAELSTVQIELNRSVAGSMLEGLAYLTGYPYGCVEQTMSRALPNAVVGRAFAQLGVGDPDLSAQLPALINAGLQQLYAFQHDDGGWGWWFDDTSDPYQTAWVLFGLQVTAEAGDEVDPGVIAQGKDYLATRMTTLDARTQAFAFYSMGLDSPDTKVNAARLAERLDELDTFSQAALALAFYRAGDMSQAKALLDHLAATATREGEFVYWSDGDMDGAYQQKTMSSALRSTALALSAFVAIYPNHPLEAGIVEWLMSKRQASGWGTTNETAFTLLALTDHLRNTIGAGATAAYTIGLNAQTVAQGQIDATKPLGKVTLDATQLTPGVNLLQLTGNPDQRLYYRIATHTYGMEAPRQRAGNVTVYREYIDPQSRLPLTQTSAGQVVEVQLTVHITQPAAYVLLEDQLPGGLEAINERLSPQNSGQPVVTTELQPSWVEEGYNYKEVRRDRVSFFITDFPPGGRTVTYRARAVATGAFVALPTEAYAMYDARIWGRSASNQFVVEEMKE